MRNFTSRTRMNPRRRSRSARRNPSSTLPHYQVVKVAQQWVRVKGNMYVVPGHFDVLRLVMGKGLVPVRSFGTMAEARSFVARLLRTKR